MRTSPFHKNFAANNATFANRFETEIVSRVGDAKNEYETIRNAAGITDFSFMQRFRFPEEKGLDFLDSLCAGNVAKLRFGRILHTFLADDDGMIIADCYIANNDEEFILLCESIADDDAVVQLLLSRGAAEAGMEDLSKSHALLSIDGYKAWAVAKELFGADVLGLPYLSIERYEYNGAGISLFRAGKTSEFGYLLLVEAGKTDLLFDACLASARKISGGLCGIDIHNDLRLEGRFFNVFAEGVLVRDPLELGLQWMIDFNKEQFAGRDAIAARRASGLSKKIIGICAAADVSGFTKGATIVNGNDSVATIVATCFSYTLDKFVGLALFSVDCAYAGLSFNLGTGEGPKVSTISMPPIMPKSLTVKLDDM